jgi:hypothetical protein
MLPLLNGKCPVIDNITQLLNPTCRNIPSSRPLTWRDWYTNYVVNATIGVDTMLSAPLCQIKPHIYNGAGLLLRSQPLYAIEEIWQCTYSRLVVQIRRLGIWHRLH